MDHLTGSESDCLEASGAVSRLMKNFTIEITPRGAAKVESFRQHLAPGTMVYVTALPGGEFDETVAVCKRLTADGMLPTPHFTARGIASRQELRERIERVTSEAGVQHVLALGGADREPAGEFEDSAEMLETGLFEQFGIKSIGIAGHPEGNSDIERLLLREFGFRKIRHAEQTGTSMYMVTQFAFEAKPVIEWVERIRGDGNRLPVVVGIPGPASLKSLIGHATNCGVGASIRFLTKQARNVTKLMTMQSPDALLRDLSNSVAERPELGIRGVHVFTLGGFANTAKWSSEMAAAQQ